jgi:hypothetical protein
LNVIDALERGKVVKEELDLTKKKVFILEDRISIRDSIILAYKQKDSIATNMENAYKSIISNYKSTIEYTEEEFQYKDKIIRRQKTSKWFTLLAGLTAGYFIYKH